MALFQKQDFAPPVLSPKWFTIQFRPNMLLYCQEHIVSILSSGLLFREDSMELEQDAASWLHPPSPPLLSTGEKMASAVGIAAALALFPPRSFNRYTVLRISCYATVPLCVRRWHRARCSGNVRLLLETMCDYLAVARRAAACCREYAALYAKLASVASVVESMQALLVRQQSDLVNLLSRTSSAVLGNSPWLRGDVDWEAVCVPGDSLMKIHHTFLVVQSLLLKHIAMAHYLASANLKKVYKNHNERIYWIHHEVIPLLIDEYRENIDSLDRIYRLLKNCAAEDSANEAKKLGPALNNVWTYADIHSDVARTCLELKIALNTSNSIDRFLDSCAMNKVDVDLEMLDKDIEELVENISKCLSTAQNSQKRVTKLKAQLLPPEPEANEEVIEDVKIVKIEDKDLEVKDEVFYCVKEEDDAETAEVGDILTGPGVKEKENSKIVLNELKRKLVKREDLMRERERQALKKTMKHTGDVPEFPRQINVATNDTKGFISKIRKEKPKELQPINRKIRHLRFKRAFKMRGELKTKKYCSHYELSDDLYKDLNFFETLEIVKRNNKLVITIWRRNASEDCHSRTFGEGSWAASIKDESRYRYTKKDLELSDSDEDNDYGRHLARIQQGRVRNTDDLPMEYSFGTGLAMASVLQVNRKGRVGMAEEVFAGDGEVSSDSGNEGGF